MIKITGRSTYRRFEDHLAYCACHLYGLAAIENSRRPSIWVLRRGQQTCSMQKMFSQAPWVYWLGGCLVVPLLGNLAFLFAIFFAVAGSRHIISRAALVAICDLILEQPEIDLSTLRPPGS